MAPGIALDTSVLLAGLQSRRGASFKVLSLIGTGAFRLALSVPLALEYEEAAKRGARRLGLSYKDVDDVVEYLCRVADRRKIFFLWRPFLRDPDDDLVLELAVEAGCAYIVTHNLRDFEGVERFGLRAVTPKSFLDIIGGNL